MITVKADTSSVDGTYVENGDAIETTIDAIGDIDTTGLTSGAAVDTDDTSIDAATHKLYRSYPTVSLASDSPSGVLLLGGSTTVAKFNVTAAVGGDVTFEQNEGNTLTVQLTSNRADDAVDNDDIISLYDGNGTLLDQLTGVDFDDVSHEFTFDFSSASLTVPDGQTRSLVIKITSQDYEDSGDRVQVWLDNAANDIDWGVNGHGSYNEAKIIFRGDIFANNLYQL